MTTTSAVGQLDPVKYEMFFHRLWAIGEEGRLAIQRVTASPIVSQGGECMCSFYNPEGVMTLACSGHLRFAGATSDAIKMLRRRFSENPGFFDGDQFFLNDPYVAGAHTFDMMIIKPIFYRDELIAWTAASIHTADTGGVMRGLATEVFHEGIRIIGLKIVEKGQQREDVFATLTEQCRDPQYVGLDLNSMIAANNVTARRYIELVEKFGLDFARAAEAKVVEDSEAMARSKLRDLPDGTWKSRVYGTAVDKRAQKLRIFQIVCSMTKKDDELFLDFTGTSPQSDDATNSTFPSTMAHLGVALSNQLYWDVPWSDGKMVPISWNIPEGSILNCKYPAAAGNGPGVGGIMVTALSECLAQMLYAGGRLDDVNAPWHVLPYQGGPGFFYGGHNREGIVTAQGLYDIHGSGLGAAPTRDGVATGGHYNIPSGGISDIERTEMQYPFIYFARNHNRDGGGFGKYAGGAGSFRIYMIYGSQDANVDYKPYGGVPQGNGVFGGYSTGTGGVRGMYSRDSGSLLDVARERQNYPSFAEDIIPEGWAQDTLPNDLPDRLSLPEFTVISDVVPGGAGYGDPLDRPAEQVANDVRDSTTSVEVAGRIYGVVVNANGGLDVEATQQRRREMREQRLRSGAPYSGKTSGVSEELQNASGWQQELRWHESLEVARLGDQRAVRCIPCGHVFCTVDENYKDYAVRETQDLNEMPGPKMPRQGFDGVYHIYSCPGCATQLRVDTYSPVTGDSDEPLWDFRAG